MAETTGRRADEVASVLLTRDQAADMLSMETRSVERLIARGILTAIRPARMRMVRLDPEEIKAWVRVGCPRLPAKEWRRLLPKG